MISLNCAFYSWLRRIAANQRLKDIRQQQRRHAALDRLRHQAPRAADPLVRVLIREAAAELSPALRAVLVLHDERGYSIPEIAAQLGISKGAARKRLRACEKSAMGVSTGQRSEPPQSLRQAVVGTWRAGPGQASHAQGRRDCGGPSG